MDHGYTSLTVNGIELAYNAFGDGEALVLLHGFTGTGQDWALVFDLDRLAERYRVILVDQRGHSRSTNPGGTLTHRQCAEDLWGLLDHLGVERFKAVGLSFGANVLLHAATGRPERVEAMVLVSAALYYPEQARVIMRAAAAAVPSDEERRAFAERHVRDEAQREALRRQPAVFAETYDDMNFTPPYLSRIAARTLIVGGDRDPLLPARIFLETYEGISGAALWILPHEGHAPIFGAWRDEFARRAVGFLRGSE